jgi:hypothetical protein
MPAATTDHFTAARPKPAILKAIAESRDSPTLKSQLRVLAGRGWRVSMEFRIGKLNRFITGWMAYFRLADTTCGYAVSPSAAPVNGRVAAKDTGGLLAPKSFRCPCPMPTGTASA